MDTSCPELPIVPFGKYKGQPITELLKDTNYVNWCKNQKWFQNYPIVYNICVNQTLVSHNSSQNSKTPEHNKLQNLFLEEQYRIKIWDIMFKNKLSMSQYDGSHKNLGLDKNSIEFEGKFNWDCIFTFTHKEKSCSNKKCCSDETFIITNEINVYCELKPLLGDDYPCVLRKIKLQMDLTQNVKDYRKTYKYYILIIDDFSSTTTTKDQLLEIFRQSYIKIIFVDEIKKELTQAKDEKPLNKKELVVNVMNIDEKTLKDVENYLISKELSYKIN